MRSHSLAEQILDLPDTEVVVASIDIATGVKDKHGDEVIAKIYASSICEVFASQGEITIHFEQSASGTHVVDPISAISDAFKTSYEDGFSLNGTYHISQIESMAEQAGLSISKTGVKQAGGQLLLVKDNRKVVMSFLFNGECFRRVF